MEYPEPWPLCYETNNYAPALSEYFEHPDILYPALPEQLAAARDAGYALVGLDMGNVQRHLQAGHGLDALREELERSNLHCLELANLTFSDDRETTLREAGSYLETARALDATFIQCSVFGDLNNAAVTARAVERKLAGSGIGLAIEFLPFSPLDSIETTRRFIRDAGLRDTKIVLDTWHLFFGPAPAQLESLPVREIAYVQFNDHALWQTADPLFETVNHRLLPGQGHFDLDWFCSILKKNGYRGPVGTEVLSSKLRTWTPRRFAEAEYQATRVFWR